MLNKKLLSLFLFFLGSALFFQPNLSHASWGDHDRHRHYSNRRHYGQYNRHHHYHNHSDHPRFGLHLSFLPSNHISFWVGPVRYHYHNGLYYTGFEGNYQVVAPPISGVVTSVPVEHRPVVVNGSTYYTNEGTYYTYIPPGYQVAAPPVLSRASSQVITDDAAAKASTDISSQSGSFVVNIPNNQGSYTPITIKKSDNGFVGPQGEFYSEFPKVSQLQTMYGKNE